MDRFGYSQERYDEILADVLREDNGGGEGEGEEEGAVKRSPLEMTLKDGFYVWELGDVLVRMKEESGLSEIVVPTYWWESSTNGRTNKEAWWFKLLSPIQKALVKAVGSWKNHPGDNAEILDYLEGKGMCRNNRAKRDAFLEELGDSEKILTNDDYVTPFLYAAGVSQSDVPDTHQLLLPTEQVVASIKEQYEQCEFKEPLDVMTEWQRQIVVHAKEYIHLIELFWLVTHPNKDFAQLVVFLRETSPCDCERCQETLASLLFCEVDHVNPEAKREFLHGDGRMKQPAQCTFSELLPQLVAGALRILCRPAHRLKDNSTLALEAAGDIPMQRRANGDTLYSRREVNNYRYETALQAAIHDNLCVFSGELFTPQTSAVRDGHHILDARNLVEVHSDGTETEHDTAKVEEIIAIVKGSKSMDDFLKRMGDEFVKVRPALCNYHKLLTKVFNSAALREMLGILLPWKERPAKVNRRGKQVHPGQVVVEAGLQLDDLPSILEPEIAGLDQAAAREEIERRFADFFAQQKFDPNAKNMYREWFREVSQIAEGAELEIKGPEDNDFRSCVVIERCSVFRVDYDNGDVETLDLGDAEFRIVGVDDSDSQNLALVEVGTRLSIEWPDDGEFYPATVAFHCPSFKVRYADGEVETVDLARVRFRLESEAESQLGEQENVSSSSQSMVEESSEEGTRAPGRQRSPRLAGEQPGAAESSSPPPAASESSNAQPIAASELPNAQSVAASGPSNAPSIVEESESSAAPSMVEEQQSSNAQSNAVPEPSNANSVVEEASQSEKATSDSMDAELLDGGRDASSDESLSLDASSPSSASSAVESAGVGASSAVVESIASPSAPPPLKVRHLVGSNHVSCDITASSEGVLLGEVRFVVSATDGSIEVHSMESDGQYRIAGHLLGSSVHHTIIRNIDRLPVQIMAVLLATSIGRFQSSILVEYHPKKGVSRSNALEALTRLLAVDPPLPPAPKVDATHVPSPSSTNSAPLSNLKVLAATPSSTPRTIETRRLQLLVRVSGAGMQVKELAGKFVRLMSGSKSTDVVEVKGDAILGEVLGAPSGFRRFVQELDDLPLTIESQILARGEYEDTAFLRVCISNKRNVPASSVFDELERLFGEHFWEEEKCQTSRKRKRGSTNS